MLRKKLFLFISALICISFLSAEVKKIRVSVDLSSDGKEISPYIFGVNDGVNLNKVQASSIRLGGNA